MFIYLFQVNFIRFFSPLLWHFPLKKNTLFCFCVWLFDFCLCYTFKSLIVTATSVSPSMLVLQRKLMRETAQIVKQKNDAKERVREQNVEIKKKKKGMKKKEEELHIANSYSLGKWLKYGNDATANHTTDEVMNTSFAFNLTVACNLTVKCSKSILLVFLLIFFFLFFSSLPLSSSCFQMGDFSSVLPKLISAAWIKLQSFTS